MSTTATYCSTPITSRQTEWTSNNFYQFLLTHNSSSFSYTPLICKTTDYFLPKILDLFRCAAETEADVAQHWLAAWSVLVRFCSLFIVGPALVQVQRHSSVYVFVCACVRGVCVCVCVRGRAEDSWLLFVIFGVWPGITSGWHNLDTLLAAYIVFILDRGRDDTYQHATREILRAILNFPVFCCYCCCFCC